MSISQVRGLGYAGKPVVEPNCPSDVRRSANAVIEHAEHTRQTVREALDKLQKLARDNSTKLDISVDSETGIYVIRVLDAQTGELIREVPPREVLNAVSIILRVAGIHIDRVA
jgi:flagellar protein FlaG